MLVVKKKIYLQYTLGEGRGIPLQYSCLENPIDGGAWWAAVHEVAKSQTRLSDFTFMHWRRKWQPTPVFFPGESQGQRSLVGGHLWGHTESDTLKRCSSSSSSSSIPGEHYLTICTCLAKMCISYQIIK